MKRRRRPRGAKVSRGLYFGAIRRTIAERIQLSVPLTTLSAAAYGGGHFASAPVGGCLGPFVPMPLDRACRHRMATIRWFRFPSFGGFEMSRKFGLSVVLFAAAALVLSEAQSFARHSRRGGGCASCGTACSTCGTAAATAANAAATQSPPAPLAADQSSPAPSAIPAAPEPPATAAASAPEVAAAPAHYYRNTRPARRGVFRR